MIKKWTKISDELPPAGEPLLICYTLSNSKKGHRLYCVAYGNQDLTRFTYLDGILTRDNIISWIAIEEYKEE